MVDVDIHISSHLKEELAQAVDKWLQVISIIKNSFSTRLKNKAVLFLNNIVYIAMWPLEMYSNCFKIVLLWPF